MRKLPKDVLKMASGLISPSGLAGHCRQLCNVTLREDSLTALGSGVKVVTANTAECGGGEGSPHISKHHVNVCFGLPGSFAFYCCFNRVFKQ